MICCCHRNQLLSECLAVSLNETGNVECHVVMPKDVLTTSPNGIDLTAVELLLLDAALDDDLSFRIIEKIKSLNCACKILLFVSEQAIDRMLELAQSSIQGYLFEGVGLNNVRESIQALLGGESYCSPQLVNALLNKVGHIIHEPEQSRQWGIRHLTCREQDILTLIAGEQLGNKQIARQLGLSLFTIKNHVHNIIEKLGVQNRREAVQVARRSGLLPGVAK